MPYVLLTTTASFETFLGNSAKPRSKHFRFHQKIFDAPFSSLLSFPARNTEGSLNGANKPKTRQITSILITTLRARYPARKASITSARERFSIHRHPASLQAGPFRHDASQGSRRHHVLPDGMAGLIRRAWLAGPHRSRHATLPHQSHAALQSPGTTVAAQVVKRHRNIVFFDSNKLHS
ncbi:hypothetical protein [Burkholderia lata]|uniref:hypothetical protein n=1 Tax=Burkholderia lata (strain ATCC 17760 / DSM 23089 / LMG 22485 / NCIMB 9086 / R18194 / 383) TaxID=482957 RepID=UPI001581CA7A|nr:hypothetical protein [Burkholderia lata]